MNSLLYAVTVLIWGTTWIAIAMQTGNVPAAVSVFYRFALAALLMIAFVAATGRLKRISRTDHLFCVLQGMCVFCFNFLCFYQANHYINSGLESVIFSMAILFNAINGVLFLGQKITSRLLVANALGLSGIISLFWHDLTASNVNTDTLLGIGLCLLGTYGFSLGNIISARHQKHGLNVFTTNTYAMSYGALTMLAVILLSGTEFAIDTGTAYLSGLFYLAIVGSVLGFGAYFLLIGRIGTGPAAYTTVMFPLVALTISTVFEGYEWSLAALIGLLLVLVGNGVMFWKPKAQAAPIKAA